jgi:hypothetical protein
MTERQLVGEIVTAEYTSFCAESYRLHQAPPLGGLVVADNVVGLVYSAHTEGLGPILRKGKEENADGEVYKQHPELERTLRTQFTALCLGYYGDAGRIRHIYPDHPPRIHYQCYLLDDEAVCGFTEHPEYLRAALTATDPGTDQALIHLLYRAYTMRHPGAGRRDHLLAATTFLSRLLKAQYDRLLAILEPLEEMLGDEYGNDGELVRGVGRVDY